MAGKKITPATAAPPASVVEPVDASSLPPVPVPDASSPVPTPPEEEEENNLCSRVTKLMDKVQSILSVTKELAAELKVVQKEVTKLQKAAAKKTAKKAGATGADGAPVVRKPSGFAKPALLTNDLCDFLGLPYNTLLTRTDVTRMINKYIKDNNLQGTDDKRTIKPDGELLKIVKLEPTATLTYFNLQSYIKQHFLPAPAPAPEAAEAAAVPASV